MPVIERFCDLLLAVSTTGTLSAEFVLFSILMLILNIAAIPLYIVIQRVMFRFFKALFTSSWPSPQRRPATAGSTGARYNSKE